MYKKVTNYKSKTYNDSNIVFLHNFLCKHLRIEGDATFVGTTFVFFVQILKNFRNSVLK